MNEKSISHFGVSLKGDAIKSFNVFLHTLKCFWKLLNWKGI
jgi:hypothetical protein